MFDVPSVASSHEVEGEVMHNSQGQNLLYFITMSAMFHPCARFLGDKNTFVLLKCNHLSIKGLVGIEVYYVENVNGSHGCF